MRISNMSDFFCSAVYSLSDPQSKDILLHLPTKSSQKGHNTLQSYPITSMSNLYCSWFSCMTVTSNRIEIIFVIDPLHPTSTQMMKLCPVWGGHIIAISQPSFLLPTHLRYVEGSGFWNYFRQSPVPVCLIYIIEILLVGVKSP